MSYPAGDIGDKGHQHRRRPASTVKLKGIVVKVAQMAVQIVAQGVSCNSSSRRARSRAHCSGSCCARLCRSKGSACRSKSSSKRFSVNAYFQRSLTRPRQSGMLSRQRGDPTISSRTSAGGVKPVSPGPESPRNVGEKSRPWVHTGTWQPTSPSVVASISTRLNMPCGTWLSGMCPGQRISGES